MDKLLRAFAGEQLQIIEVTETRSPQRQKLIDEGYKLHNELEEKLNSGEKELLERLIDVNSEEKPFMPRTNLSEGIGWVF